MGWRRCKGKRFGRGCDEGGGMEGGRFLWWEVLVRSVKRRRRGLRVMMMKVWKKLVVGWGEIRRK